MIETINIFDNEEEFEKLYTMIVETIEEGPFDLVVLGSRGLGRREFGGVSSRVADRANCPVLIVK